MPYSSYKAALVLGAALCATGAQALQISSLSPQGEVARVRQVVAKSTKSVALLVQRGEDKIFVPVRMG